MRKSILLASAMLCAAQAFAQVEDANRVILHAKDGTVHAFTFDQLDYMDFDKVGEISLTATLVEGSATDTGFSISVQTSEDCAAFTVAYSDVAPTTYNSPQVVALTGLEPETDYTVTLTPYDKYALAGTPVTISATTTATPAPKIGDYFYSDGTWSDGGLISIDLTGQNAVWAETKPEPLAGKTVVGIVCITDPARIDPADAAAGYTHGYVIACKNATDPTKSNYDKYPESVWYGDATGSEIEYTKVAKISSTCYERINGSSDTREMLSKFEHPELDVRMFHYCTTGFPVAAPANTSGWFVPAMGQLWDCIANFCSGKVADALLTQRTDRYDITYYFSEKTKEPVLKNFMRVFEKVPAADKDDIKVYDDERNKTIALLSCNRYNTESAVHFNLGDNEDGLIEGMAGWFNEEGHARPMLAF